VLSLTCEKSLNHVDVVHWHYHCCSFIMVLKNIQANNPSIMISHAVPEPLHCVVASHTGGGGSNLPASGNFVCLFLNPGR
jgi:hypothetical protein